MSRPIPIVPTLVVLIAVAVMVRLGFWQIDRLHQKEAMLSRYAAAGTDTSVHPWQGGDPMAVGYRRVQVSCRNEGGVHSEAGRNALGQTGWAAVAGCVLPQGGEARIVLGWSAAPATVAWTGGEVIGTALPRGELVVVADPPLAGLQPNAKPDPRDIPNNHFAYAVQWFLFAGVALVIYVLALRKRSRG